MPHPYSPSRRDRDPEDVAVARLTRRVVAQWRLVAVCAVAAAVAGYVLSSGRTEQYRALTQIQLNEVDLPSVFLGLNLQQQGQDAEAKTATNAELVQLPQVREEASKLVDRRVSADDIKDALTVAPKAGTTLVDLTVEYPDPVVAAEVANAVREAFIASRRSASGRQFGDAERDLTRQLNGMPSAERDSEAADGVRDRLAQVRTLRTVSNGGIETVQAAEVPTERVSPHPRRDALLALFAGALIGLAGALLRARLDDRVREADELGEIWDLPVVGQVPESQGLSTPGAHLPEPSSLESFSLARTNLRYLRVGGDVKVVVVTSAIPAEGKSTVAWNLALAAALAGSHVLLVEGDLRKPVLGKRLHLHPGPGLSEVLAGMASPSEAIQSITLSDRAEIAGSIAVLPAGMTPPSPIALLEGAATAALFSGLRASYDIIFVDSPPATVVADAMVLMDAADGALVVARLNRTTRGAAERLKQTLEGHGTPVLGQVINGGGLIAGYGYGYAYGDDKPTAAASRTPSNVNS